MRSRSIRTVRTTSGASSRRARLLTGILIALGAAGVLDTLALLLAGVGGNSGTFFFGLAGLPCLVWGLWRIRRGQTPRAWHPVIRRMLALAAAAWLLSFLAFLLLLRAAARDDSAGPVGYAIVLGGGLHGDRVSEATRQRLETAARYLLAHPAVEVVVSGGVGPGASISEATAMAEYLSGRGVARERILLEGRSLSTWQNLRYSKALLERRGVAGPVLLVTSDFHLLRAKLLARRLGLEVHGLPAPTPWYQYPNCLAREYFALGKSWLLDR